MQLLFLKRLHRLLLSGYALIEALEVMKWDKRLANSAERIIIRLKEGFPIDQAFEKENFHDTIIAYLYFVRINSNLTASLEKCIIMFEQRITYIKKFTRVIRYPIFLFTIFIFLLIFLKQSVLPSFITLFQSSTESTQIIILFTMLIDILSSIFIVLIGLVLILSVFWYFYKQHVDIKYQIAIYKKIPLYRSFLTMQTSYYFATHLSMFLKAGMPMKEILENISKQNKLPILAYYGQLMIEQLKNGVYIDALLKKLPLFENQLGNIFQKNNNIEALEQDLSAFAQFISETLERKIMQMITMIQPVFFFILASFIILIYLTLMWPMFQLIQTT